MHARILIASMLVATSGLAWADVLDGSLKLRLNFETAPVDNVVPDTNPNAEKHHGVNGSADGANLPATWIATEGGRAGVMSFDGAQPNQITVDAAPAFNATQGTVAFWMKSSEVTQTPNPYAIVFDRRSAGGDLLFQTPGGNLANQAQQASGGGANAQTTGANVTDGQWHHIAYVYDQAPTGSTTLYVDGVLDVSGPNSLSWSWVTDLALQIGKSNNSWWAAYTGFLDDFRFYDRMLTPAEVADVAGLGSQPKVVIGPAGQPKDLAVGNNDTPSFTVTATVVNGDPTQLTYQWQKDSVNISNATAAKFTFLVSLAEDRKKFRCVVSYPGAPSVTSAEATLTVLPEVGLIFNFDAAPVADVIVDSAPNPVKHDGANAGGTWVASEGTRQGIMTFDGSLPSQITVSAAPELNSQRGTIAFWMKSPAVTQSPNPYAILFDRRGGSSGDVIYQAPDGHLADQAQAGGGTLVEQSTGANLTDTNWHHVAYVYDQTSGGFVSFYVDGVLDTTKPNSRAWSWEPELPLEIGKSHDSWWSAYTGSLDEFRIYNRVLAASEIAGLAGLGPQAQIVINDKNQPQDLALGASDTASFRVTATVVNGDPAKLVYQWQKDRADIPGATSATHSLTATTNDSGKKFRCVVSYPGATGVTSSEAALTVLPEFVVRLDFATAPAGDVVVDTAPDPVHHDGTNLGATWVANESGRDGVMSFDGLLPSQITLAAAADLNSMRGTIAFWMKSAQTTPTPNPYAMLFDRRAMPAEGVTVTGGEVLYQLPDGHVSNQAEVAGRARANEFSTAANLTDNKWHHVAYVYDQTANGFVSYYVDGLLDGTKANSRSWYWLPEQTIELGLSHDTWWSGYTGFLDDFRIYNRVLSGTEIAALAGTLPSQLSIGRNGNQVTLTWDTGTLWSSSTVDGTYTELTTATSPHVVTPTPGQQQFYRARR